MNTKSVTLHSSERVVLVVAIELYCNTLRYVTCNIHAYRIVSHCIVMLCYVRISLLMRAATATRICSLYNKSNTLLIHREVSIC